MPRHPFGGGPEGVIVDPRTGAVQPGAQGTMWSAQQGGTQRTDLLSLSGTPLPSGVVTADTNGRIRLLGPNDVLELWADFGRGRWRLEADDLITQLSGLDGHMDELEETLSDVTASVATLTNGRGQPGGTATPGPDGTVPYTQLPPMPVGASRLADLTDVAAPTPARGQALVHDGTVWRPGVPGPAVRVATTTTPLYIASMGGRNIYPANTLQAALANAAAGVNYDCTVNVTADDIAVVVVDPVDNYTVLTGSPTNLYFNGLAREVVDAEAWFGAGWGAMAVPTLADILVAGGGRVVVTIECQTARAVVKAVEVVRRLNLIDSVIIQSFTQADLAPAAAAGITCLLLHATGSGLDTTALKNAGITWLGLSTSATAATVQTLIAAGMKVAIYTINRHVDRDVWLARGVHGLFSDDPYYLQDPSRYRRKASPFTGQTYPHGFQASVPASGRGAFTDLEVWRPTSASGGPNHVLQGWACPMDVNANAWTMQFDIVWSNVASADTNTYAVAVFGCPTDVAITDTTATTDNGYMVKFAFTGALTLSKRINGVLTTGPTVTTTAPTAGQVITYTIAVTASAVTVTRVGAATPNSITWADTTLRGRYLHLGMRSTVANRIGFRRLSYL